jgi:outer membrane protein OmpA-like peptidoglycan-associated protein
MKLTGLALVCLCVWGAAAYAQQANYRVYFDFQVKNLTQTADEVAARAVQDAGAQNATEIDLVGHADTAEKKGMALSLARAKAVKAALLSHGLSKAIKVTIKGVGASDPFAPTGPNVREPLNRFVAVAFH